jgi:uncharacterized protein with LGFP repeats
MCCTVNNGVNACPPGSFAGGWWKADNAALCGGGARYYIDCQAECTGCSSGCNPFCDSGCWNCQCHCASGTCDQRRVCCNVFRYGQCNQQIACGGPVLCRAISCMPPYEWMPCSTATATDDTTTDHSAPCLPGWDIMELHYYSSLGGPKGYLGVTVGAPFPIPGGWAQAFTLGEIYWSSATGARGLNGAIIQHFRSLGGTSGVLGFPTTDVIPNGDNRGWHADFQNGSIYWSATTGAHMLNGAFKPLWISAGGLGGYLGYPTDDPVHTSDGVGWTQTFERGQMWYHDGVGAHWLNAAMWSHYLSLGSTAGPLGYPTSNPTLTSNGRGWYASCQAGSLYWSAMTNAHAVYGPIYQAYAARRGPVGRLGFPVSDQYAWHGAGGNYQRVDFEHGYALEDGQGNVTVHIH